MSISLFCSHFFCLHLRHLLIILSFQDETFSMTCMLYSIVAVLITLLVVQVTSYQAVINLQYRRQNVYCRLRPLQLASQVEDDGWNLSRSAAEKLLQLFPFMKKAPGTLILVRHGESEWNYNKTFTGQFSLTHTRTHSLPHAHTQTYTPLALSLLPFIFSARLVWCRSIRSRQDRDRACCKTPIGARTHGWYCVYIKVEKGYSIYLDPSARVESDIQSSL